MKKITWGNGDERGVCPRPVVGEAACLRSELRAERCEGASCVKICESTFQAGPTANEGGHDTGIRLIGSRNRKRSNVAGIQRPRE